MKQLDRIPKEIFKYWSKSETDLLKIQVAHSSDLKGINSYIFFLGESSYFNPYKIFAFGDDDTILYCWQTQENQFTESEFLKILKMKAFI